MSCGFCHVGPNPDQAAGRSRRTRGGRTSARTSARSISGCDRIFNWKGDTNAKSFVFQLFHTSRPGTLDTSLVSTDNINNPRTMNAVYQLGPRMGLAKQWGKETLAGGGLNNQQFNDFVPPARSAGAVLRRRRARRGRRACSRTAPIRSARSARSTASTSTSGCSARSGCCTSAPLIGGKAISPIEIADAPKELRRTGRRPSCRRRTWRASSWRAPTPHHLKDAPGGARVSRPRTPRRSSAARSCSPSAARAATRASCRRCRAGLDLENCNGKDYLGVLEQLLGVDEDRRLQGARCARSSLADDFLDGQLPVDRAARAGHADADQRLQPARDQRDRRQHLGQLLVAVLQGAAVGRHRSSCGNPLTGAEYDYTLPGGGRGFTRPASLVSAVVDGAVPAEQHRRPVRPEPVGRGAHARRSRRRSSRCSGRNADGRIRLFANEHRRPGRRLDRSDDGGQLHLGAGRLRPRRAARPARRSAERLFPVLFRNGEVEIGPIPEGHAGQPAREHRPARRRPAARPSGRRTRRSSWTCSSRPKDELKRGNEHLRRTRTSWSRCSTLSKCPDFVVNKGHYFGTSLRGRTRAERRRQARAHRIPEDVLV